jgi:hypothetical protein
LRTVSSLYEILLSIVGDKSNGEQPPFGGRKFPLFDDAFSDQRVGQGKYHMLGLAIVIVKCRSLANFFNIQINRLADSFLMEIGANVNPGTGKPRFSKIPFENRTNMQFQIVVCEAAITRMVPIAFTTRCRVGNKGLNGQIVQRLTN